MGRTWLHVDPPGYRFCSEPGFDFRCTGAEFLAAMLADGRKPDLFNHFFYNPPGMEWLLPMPRQFNPAFYKDSRLDQHVVTRSLWTFAAGVLAAEFELTKKADGTSFPKNKWVHVTSIPAGTVSLDNTNFSALGAAAGADPTTAAALKTIATASTSPAGASLTTTGHLFTPMLQYSMKPAPDDLLVFGFGNLALVLQGDTVTLCRSPLNDRQSWVKLDRWSGSQAHGGYWRPTAQEAFSGFGGIAADAEIRLRMVKTLLVGFQHLQVLVGQHMPPPVKLSDTEGPQNLWPAGHWWWAAAPGQHFWFQTQVMGYESASTTFAVAAGKPLSLWKTGKTYKSTMPYLRKVDALVHSELSPASDLTTDDTAGILTYSSAYTGNTLAFAVTDENGNVLVTDGTHSEGAFSLSLIPSTPGFGSAGAYLAPQLRAGELKLQVKQEDRLNEELLLSDLHFRDWTAEVSYREPTGKTFSVSLKQTGAAAFYAGNYHRRGNYPVHIVEDTDGDDVPDTIRVRAWVKKGRLTKLAVRSDDGTVALRENVLQAGGLLSRMDRKPDFLPQLVDPTAVKIKHTSAVRQMFLYSGMDATVDTYIHIPADPRAGTGWEFLPEAGNQNSEADKKSGYAWAPRWDETRLGYVERLATTLFGWVLFETLTEIWYAPELVFDLVNAGTYFRSATIYRSQANAVAAGVPARQSYRPGAEDEQQEPLANRVRMLPKDWEDHRDAWKLDTWTPSITDPMDTDTFIGEPITEDLVLEEGYDEETVTRAARVFIAVAARRTYMPTVELASLAPWEIQGNDTVDAGYVAQFEGVNLNTEDQVIVHVEVKQVTSRPDVPGSYYETRLVGEKLPFGTGAIAGGSPGAWPGNGA